MSDVIVAWWFIVIIFGGPTTTTTIGPFSTNSQCEQMREWSEEIGYQGFASRISQCTYGPSMLLMRQGK